MNPNEHIKITACIPNKRPLFILDTVNQLIIKKEGLCKYTLWALLNSKLINWYVFRFIYGKAVRTMHFDSPITNRIPLPISLSESAIKQIHGILAVKKEEIFIVILDALVFNLYFPDHMAARGIDVLEFVEWDINEVMKSLSQLKADSSPSQGEQHWGFENLSEAEKEQVIEALRAKWSDPDNEVVKRMALFKERSPEILKPILES